MEMRYTVKNLFVFLFPAKIYLKKIIVKDCLDK